MQLSIVPVRLIRWSQLALSSTFVVVATILTIRPGGADTWGTKETKCPTGRFRPTSLNLVHRRRRDRPVDPARWR